jgi:hypothetical protein
MSSSSEGPTAGLSHSCNSSAAERLVAGAEGIVVGAEGTLSGLEEQTEEASLHLAEVDRNCWHAEEVGMLRLLVGMLVEEGMLRELVRLYIGLHVSLTVVITARRSCESLSMVLLAGDRYLRGKWLALLWC